MRLKLRNLSKKSTGIFKRSTSFSPCLMSVYNSIIKAIKLRMLKKRVFLHFRKSWVTYFNLNCKGRYLSDVVSFKWGRLKQKEKIFSSSGLFFLYIFEISECKIFSAINNTLLVKLQFQIFFGNSEKKEANMTKKSWKISS